MKALGDACLGFLAGFVITTGASAYLSLDSTMAGALMFVVGLFAICSFGWNLFTGKVCYSIGKGPKYIGFLAVVWLSNFAGAAAGGALLRMTRLTACIERAQELCAVKLGDSLASVFVLAIFCNILIYIAVEGYRARFCAAMDEDFNTREAIAVMFEMARATNKSMADGTLSREEAEAMLALIGEFDSILGIMPEDAKDEGLDEIMGILIDLRKELRSRKMYDLSDLIRDRLKEAGFVLEDSAEGAKWKRA